MPATPSFQTIRYSTFDRLVARINRPPVMDAEFDGLAWTVPAHVADRAMQRQVS
jgi:hypothetical protein